MLKVGLTGGIGSGKSYICKVFRTLGIPVYESDIEAKRLMQDNGEVQSGIIEIFGSKSYIDGKLNNLYISDKVFKDNQLLAKLNAVVHPAVHLDFMRWMKTRDNTPYVIKEAAILFESGASDHMDYNILVVADESTRISRVTKRDNVSEEQVRDRIANQMSDEKKKKLADSIIYNENDSMVLQQIVDLHQKILNI